ncbi:STAS domain-containing protein [Gloeocapsa sp. PCC 73106]|uniref:STAS domain-containing protein n=1 Tax=Gloeocapsa sp. PCC 73106 TaxID=102232 RepID=UPI0002ACA778|nr:STAS domain-containing protein [Gloeocapsa sp. PCC 73106]ELR98155.1 anti-anti-sigma factor [Gloeocapsa sp. PCC 73106]
MRSNLNRPGFSVLEPEGYLCAANAQSFQQKLTQSVSCESYGTIIVDMTKVEFLDSAGLMSILSGYRLARNLGKRFSICSLTPGVKMIFELTQLDRALDIFESFSEFESALVAT